MVNQKLVPSFQAELTSARGCRVARPSIVPHTCELVGLSYAVRLRRPQWLTKIWWCLGRISQRPREQTTRAPKYGATYLQVSGVILPRPPLATSVVNQCLVLSWQNQQTSTRE
ncbi:hypothetical protein L1O48_05625 [Ligilactobacillus equi]|uniref:hypothetical protein n=1 Tax=Ligilactobacillus equi TaxID=137357 RepID=UPI002ED3B065